MVRVRFLLPYCASYGERPEIPLDLIYQTAGLTVPRVFRTGCFVSIARPLDPGLFLRGLETRSLRDRIDCWIRPTVGEYLKERYHRRRKVIYLRIQPLEPRCHLFSSPSVTPSVPFLHTFSCSAEKGTRPFSLWRA